MYHMFHRLILGTVILLLPMALLSPTAAGAGNRALKSLTGSDAGQVRALPPEPGPAAPYGANPNFVGDATELPSGKGVRRVANVRWDCAGDKNCNWDTARIKPSGVREVYWGQTDSTFGHTFLVFRMAPGSFGSERRDAPCSQYLVASFESTKRGGAVILGEIWIFSTWEAYKQYKSAIGEKLSLYRFASGVDNTAVLNAALNKTREDRTGGHFNLLRNNCNLNALAVLRRGVPAGWGMEGTSPHGTTRDLLGRGIIYGPVSPGTSFCR